MFNLSLPEYKFEIKEEKDKKFILDKIRKRYVLLTPEEWVRQNFVQYLIREIEIPESHIVIEQSIVGSKLKKRCDIIVYSSTLSPILIVECKSPTVAISQKTFDQIAKYNLQINAQYLVVTNGNYHYVCILNHEKKSYQFITSIPKYQQMF